VFPGGFGGGGRRCTLAFVPPLTTSKALPLDPEALTRELAELGDLTPRQEQVIRLILFGQTLPQIGIRLGLGTRTAKLHRNAAFERLGVQTTGELWGLLFEYGGHVLEPLGEFPVNWAQVLGNIGVDVTVERIMRISGRPRAVVIRQLRKHGYEVK